MAGEGVGEEGADADQDHADGERRRPLAAKNVQADVPVNAHIGVVDLGLEAHSRRPVRVARRKVNGQGEDAAVVGRVHRAQDSGRPVEDARVVHRAGGAVLRRVALQLQQLTANAILGRNDVVVRQ